AIATAGSRRTSMKLSKKLSPSLKRCAWAFAAAATGALVAGFAWNPWALLVTITAACICRGWRVGLAVLVAADLWSYAMLAEAPRDLAIFVATGLGVWLLVLMFRSERFFDRVYEGMRPSVEDIPGLGWFAYPGGRLRFINPAALSFVGVSAEEMRRLID